MAGRRRNCNQRFRGDVWGKASVCEGEEEKEDGDTEGIYTK